MVAGPKEFGKLSGDQLRQLVTLLPELEQLVREFQSDIRTSAKVQAAIRKDGVWWAPLYEYPFEQHLALCFKGLGLEAHLLAAVKTADAQEQLLRWTRDEKFVESV